MNARNASGEIQIQSLQQQDTTKRVVSKNGRLVNNKSPFHKDNPNAKDSTLRYPFDDENANQEFGSQKASPLYLKDPKNILTSIQYDPETGNYILVKRIGDM